MNGAFMSRFRMSIVIKPRPWPFRWGPFGRNEVAVLDVAGLRVFISRHEYGVIEPFKVVRFSLAQGCLVLADVTGKIPSVTRVDF